MKRLFGTDGIRGVAGEAPLDPPTVRRFGRALAATLEGHLSRKPVIVLGIIKAAFLTVFTEPPETNHHGDLFCH